MFKLTFFKLFFASILLLLGLQACNRSAKKQPSGPDTLKIKHLIAAGKRLENINNDSILIVAKKLYALNDEIGNTTALVYAQMFEATYYWQAANHTRSMVIAINCLANAQKYSIKQPLPEIYGLIGSLNKEITNYNMAFIAADSGLSAAISNKDTASIIALLGLKAMFTRGLTLNHQQLAPHQPFHDDKSIDMNLEALGMAESNPRYEKLRIRFYDNICQYYKDKKDFAKAFYYGNKGVALAIKYNQLRSLTYSYCWLGEANYYTGKQALGIDYLNKAMQIAKKLDAPYRIMEIKECFYDCYTSSGDYKDAISYYDASHKMRDSLKVLDNVKQIGELQVKYETARKDAQINSLDTQDKLERLYLYAALIVLVLLIVIGILIYVKEQEHKNLILSEKSRVDTELKNATLELLYFTENLTQKNELIEEFKAKIEHLQNVNKADTDSLGRLLNEHIMTDEKWENFKKLFTKVHTTFFNNLRQKYPVLTATDTRMLSLVKLQLGNNEMANMLGVTIEGVKKSKQRLRKKMELDKDDSLENVVNTL